MSAPRRSSAPRLGPIRPSALGAETVGRAYGGGILKLEPEVNSLRDAHAELAARRAARGGAGRGLPR